MDTQNSPATIDAYIAQFSPEIQDILAKVRAVIRAEMPQAVEKIGYQMPGFYGKGGKGGLIWFAAYQHHIGLYPTPAGIEAFKNELAGYKSAKGSVQFPLDQPIPYELIARIARYRVNNNTL